MQCQQAYLRFRFDYTVNIADTIRLYEQNRKAESQSIWLLNRQKYIGFYIKHSPRITCCSSIQTALKVIKTL